MRPQLSCPAIAIHMPVSFLDITAAAITYIIFLGYGGYALSRIKRKLTAEWMSSISSHDVEFVARVADRVYVMNNGGAAGR